MRRGRPTKRIVGRPLFDLWRTSPQVVLKFRFPPDRSPLPYLELLGILPPP
jgi:hypothetical protein